MKHESVWKPSCPARRWQQSSKQFVILRSSAFKPESIRPCGRRLATHRRMAVATVLVAVVLEVWSYRRNSGFLYKTCFSWCFNYISSCACSCTSVKWNEAGWKHEWSLCRGPASSAGGFAITERGRLCPRRWNLTDSPVALRSKYQNPNLALILLGLALCYKLSMNMYLPCKFLIVFWGCCQICLQALAGLSLPFNIGGMLGGTLTRFENMSRWKQMGQTDIYIINHNNWYIYIIYICILCL